MDNKRVYVAGSFGRAIARANHALWESSLPVEEVKIMIKHLDTIENIFFEFIDAMADNP
jgi:hypothetical protein